MFSYLRHHRRTPSNPTSPVPEQIHSWEPSLHHTTDHAYHTGLRSQDVNISQRSPNLSSSPAFPGPVARVAPQGHDQSADYRQEETLHEEESRSHQWPALGNSRVATTFTPDSQQWTQRQRPESAGNAGVIRPAGTQSTRPQAGITTSQALKERSVGEPLPFITAADLPPSVVPTGRRPTGTRLSTPPPPPPQIVTSTFEAAQPRSGKTRLNLLNPMSLLARRRTSQGASYPTPTQFTPSLAESNPLNVYDPRIRGTKVHDFSAPRPRRNVSYNDVQGLSGVNLGNTQYQYSTGGQYGDSGPHSTEERDSNRWTSGNHTPVFTEDFDEEQYPAAGPHVRKANDVADLQSPRPPYVRGAPKYPSQPSIAAGSDSEASQSAQGTETPGFRTSLSNGCPPLLQKVDTESNSQSSSNNVEIKDKSSSDPESLPRSLPSTKTRSRGVSDVSAKDTVLLHQPKHMQSTSSRFSFDMIGAASQEKLLEDRHRQKALEKKSSSSEPQDEYENEGDDDFNYDNMDDDDGLEERIPGVNADAEDDEFGEPTGQSQGMGGFTFHSLGISIATSPLSPYSPGMASTPRDANGEIIGFAISKESPNLRMHQTPQFTASPESPADTDPMNSGPINRISGYNGLELQGVHVSHDAHQQVQAMESWRKDGSSLGPPSKGDADDDDLYFDDGIIDHLNDGGDEHEFDESVFDIEDTDEYGRPLRPLSSLPTLYSPPFIKPDNRPLDQGGSRMSQELQDPNSAASPRSQTGPDPHHSITDKPRSLDQPLQPGPSLTHDTLSAYQSALAAAAYNAAANGRFRRGSSPTLQFDEREEHPGMMADESHLTSELSIHQPLSPDYDDFDYDDALEDDPIIAEANAEALANDSDGFYGQEFGFYSAPAAGEAQFGGYFGPHGANGLAPTQSGRIASREPNLTPITERSEYSNRNSIMSLPLSNISHGIVSGSLNSPGLVQLAGMMNEYDEENMSFSALLKLRRGAWGGSQASLRSSNGNGSPMSAAGEDGSPVQYSALAQTNAFGHARQNSAFSIGSDFAASEMDSAPASPTLTMSTPSKPQTDLELSGTPAPPAVLVSSLQSRPMSPNTKRASALGMVSPVVGDKENTFVRGKGKHHHTASLDSISYMKEDDPVAGERWVLERRRTAESGEVEILGREVVRGGRI